jgi:hypothetical protein
MESIEKFEESISRQMLSKDFKISHQVYTSEISVGNRIFLHYSFNNHKSTGLSNFIVS